MKWVLTAIAALLVTSIVLVVKIGLQPKAVAVIDLSHIERPEQAGVLAFRALQPVVEHETALVFGNHPNVIGSAEIVAGFVKSMKASGVSFGENSLLQMNSDQLVGPQRLKFLEDFETKRHFKPMMLVVLPLNVDSHICLENSVVFNLASVDFGNCAAFSLLNRAYRKKYSAEGHFVALQNFGQKTFVLFVQ